MTLPSARIACVIPTLNAAPTLPAVVSGLHASLREPFVVVIDDGSSDDTTAIARRVAELHGGWLAFEVAEPGLRVSLVLPR